MFYYFNLKKKQDGHCKQFYWLHLRFTRSHKESTSKSTFIDQSGVE